MNRLRRHLLSTGLNAEAAVAEEIAILGPFTARVFSSHGKQPGQRYEMNARGEGFDPLQCREPHRDEDGRPSLHVATYGRVGLGSDAVRRHLRDRPRLP